MEKLLSWFKNIPAKMKSIPKHFKNWFSAVGKFVIKRKILVGSLSLAVVLVAAGVIFATSYVHRIKDDPGSFFNNQTAAPVLTDDPSDTDDSSTDEPDTTDVPPTPTPTLSPYDQLNSQADQTITNTSMPLNIMLIGMDWAEERVDNKKEYVNKDFNSDVMMDLAIDFNNNKVNMISVPRDSYAKIVTAKGPISGIYKLNFSLTAGGGINAKDGAGFMSVCKSVQYIFDDKGRIPINYYIAVTMPTIKTLVDDIGGVDYPLDITFTIDGRTHTAKSDGKGGFLPQHMDGQDVLDYARIRKGQLSSGFGDLNRVNRQKDILKCVFEKLQSDASILNVPQMLTSMSGNVFTNLNFSQLAALAVFGSKLPEKNISLNTVGFYSPGKLTSSYDYGVFSKNYVLINQTARVKLLTDIFGAASVSNDENRYSPGTAQLLWAYMQGAQYVKVIDNVLAKEAKLPDDQKKLIDPTQNAQLATAEAATKALLSKDKKQANSNGTTSQATYTALQNQVKALYNLANPMFSKAGYKVNWAVPIYTKGQLRMKE